MNTKSREIRINRSLHSIIIHLDLIMSKCWENFRKQKIYTTACGIKHHKNQRKVIGVRLKEEKVLINCPKCKKFYEEADKY